MFDRWLLKAFALLFCFSILTLWVNYAWPAAVFEAGIFLLTAIVMWRSNSAPFRFCFPVVPLLFALAVGIVQIWSGRTIYSFYTRAETLQWAAFLGSFVTAAYLFREPQARSWFRSAFIAFAAFLAILTILEIFTSGGKAFWIFQTEVDPLPGTMLSYNHYAAFVELALPFALYRGLQEGTGEFYAAAVAALLYSSVVASTSRAGVFLTTAELIAVPLLMWSRGMLSRRSASRLAGIYALVAVFVAVVGWNAVWRRYWIPDPAADRRAFAVASLHMIADRPWLGSGLGTWTTIYPSYAQFDDGTFINRAHCDWLQWSAEGGIPLGLFMVGLFAWCLRQGVRTFWGIGVTVVFLHAVVDYPFARPALGSLAFVIMAMMAVESPSRKKGALDYPLRSHTADFPETAARVFHTDGSPQS